MNAFELFIAYKIAMNILSILHYTYSSQDIFTAKPMSVQYHPLLSYRDITEMCGATKPPTIALKFQTPL